MTLRPLSDRFSTALIVIVAALAMSASGGLARIDFVLYDLGQRLLKEAVPSDLVIVAIDEDSLAKLGRWPWSRRLHATLIDRLKRDGARVIALDLIFAEPDTADQPADAELATAIARAGNVVLPVLLESSRINGQVLETLPLPQLLEPAAGLGRVHAELDADGIARSVFLWEGVGTPAWPHFAQAVLAAAHELPPGLRVLPPTVANAQPFALVRREQRRIRFMGPPGQVPSLSYVQVLTGEFPRGLFNNKIVLVGATAAGMGDQLPTPVSGLNRPMPGVEFHANVIESMRRNQLIRSVPAYWVLIASALLALLPLLWLPRSTPLAGLLATSAWLLIVAVAAMGLPRWLHVWLPLSGSLFAIVIAYPVWSWRRLETAGRFLDHELKRMRQDLQLIEGATEGHASRVSSDPLQSRILQVQAATQRLRHLQSERNETLAFISHDLRAPLAGALLKLDAADASNASLRAPLARALALAEDFLATSRAEMADRQRFQEIDLSAVLHQAADDAYAVARAQSQRLLRDIPDEPVWLPGDFGLLHRAVLNLLLNALKYAPSDSIVSLQLNGDDAMATVSVSDQGPGIADDQVARLFQRFSRVDAEGAIAEGSGLGLYFVRTVAEKHSGSVVYTRNADGGSCFTMHLPLHL
jgi:CHASE2 domain-containing sensor protein/anti-sigma regulatory factor (Ser/Thr protein kinase)